MKRMGQDIVQDSIWEHDNNLEEDQEDDGDDRDTFDMWDITVEDIERIRQFLTPNVPDIIEDILNVAMVNEEDDPTRVLEEPKRLLVEDPHFTKIQLLQEDAHGGVLG
ncbi:hypothetical protein Tco_0927805 [Tanacetum coccineum]